jgi:hypothetical protein
MPVQFKTKETISVIIPLEDLLVFLGMTAYTGKVATVTAIVALQEDSLLRNKREANLVLNFEILGDAKV